MIDTEAVKKMLVFLYTDPGPAHPLGTGFLIAVPKKGAANPHDRITRSILAENQLVLVTVRHIVDPDWAFCPPDPSIIYMRVNKKKYDAAADATGVEYLPLHLIVNGVRTYYVSEDSKVDAAIVDVRAALDSAYQLSQEKYDYAAFSVSNFANPTEIKSLVIGDSIASAGLLPKASGEKRNYPFFKFGAISNMPDEPIYTSCAPQSPPLRLERVWFIAANLVPGNSGSPIFFVPSEACITGGPIHCERGLYRPIIIGVQSTTFDGADISGMTLVEDVFKLIEQHAGPDADLWRREDWHPFP